MTGPFVLLCYLGEKLDIFVRLYYRKWLMLFSLKLQRDNRQNALSVAPAKRKIGEKGCIFNILWR